MKFSEIAKRLTGISTPIFGVSWQPSDSERTVARRVIAQLEDRRVLFVASEMEIPEHCVRSVLEIRQQLTAAIAAVGEGSELSSALRAMRAACRKFLASVHSDERIIQFGASRGHYASWHFNGAVGELRGVFGIHLAKIAAQFGLDIEDELASILPAPDSGAET